jgi:hypothetical protein
MVVLLPLAGKKSAKMRLSWVAFKNQSKVKKQLLESDFLLKIIAKVAYVMAFFRISRCFHRSKQKTL